MLYTIADLNLSLGTDKPMDVFSGWRDYVERLEKNWRAIVNEEDTVVLAGDLSWAMKLEDTAADFAFLNALPGQKLLLKGNHDYWWTTAKKMTDFFTQSGFSTLRIVHNNAYPVGNVCVCGTRGWSYDCEKEEDLKILNRECGRLRASLDCARKTDLEPVVFLHYPPVYGDYVCAEILDVLKERGVRRCYYGHIHGAAAKRAVQGAFDGISFRMVSCDTTGFMPVLVP